MQVSRYCLKKRSLDIALHIESKLYPSIQYMYRGNPTFPILSIVPRNLFISAGVVSRTVPLCTACKFDSYHESNDVWSNWSDFLNHIQIRCWSHWNQDSSFFFHIWQYFPRGFYGFMIDSGALCLRRRYPWAFCLEEYDALVELSSISDESSDSSLPLEDSRITSLSESSISGSDTSASGISTMTSFLDKIRQHPY